MLSLYRAWLGPSPCVARPAPPPGAHRPVPRRARAPSPSPPESPLPQSPPPPPSPTPSSTTSSELDVERIEAPEPPRRTSGAVLDVASCDGPVRFSRVLNAAWREAGAGREWPCRHRKPRAPVHYYPCKTCGCKFPSYYFVHKHRKRCHGEEVEEHREREEPSASTSAAAPQQLEG